MSEQITWTHVDKRVRKMHDDRGMLPIGNTDAEVAHAFLGWLQRENETLRSAGASLETKLAWTETSLRAAQNRPIKKAKTKERLAKLEKEVRRLSKMLEDPPIHLPFDIGKCANRHCQSKAREISPYCEKCEPDL